jgi:hypothetical protein
VSLLSISGLIPEGVLASFTGCASATGSASVGNIVGEYEIGLIASPVWVDLRGGVMMSWQSPGFIRSLFRIVEHPLRLTRKLPTMRDSRFGER